MTRILSSGTAPQASSIVPSDWRGHGEGVGADTEARVDAARILLDARAQARAIITSAQGTAIEVAAAERRQSWEAGYGDGLEEGLREATTITSRLSLLVGSAKMAHEQTLHNGDRALVDLAVSLAGAMAKHALELNPDIIVRVAREAIEEVAQSALITLRVHPGDDGILESNMGSLSVASTTTIRVVADPTVSLGGLIVEGGCGYVDATLETRLRRAELLLHEQLG